MYSQTFQDFAAPSGYDLRIVQTDPREEIIIRYTRGTGRFSPDKKYISLTMSQFTMDDEPDGYHEGVWEAQFKDPRELISRPANPTGALNVPTGPIEHVAVVAYTKGIWVFGDGSSITAAGPALSHLMPLTDGSFLFAVTCGQIITNGTGRYARAQGLKTSLGSTLVARGTDLFGPGDIQFTAATVDTFRVVADPAPAPRF